MSFRVGSEWRAQGRCYQLDPDSFFASAGRPRKDAATPCTDCPVRQECLDFALSSPWEPYGIWGGLPASEIRPLWHQRHPAYRSEIQQLLGI